MRSKPFFRISVRYSAFLLAMLCILSIGSISLSQGDSDEESPSVSPVMLGLQVARDIIEEELGPPLRMRRWRFYEDDWSNIASWSLYKSFGIDNCVADVPVLQKRSHILFGWTFSILDTSNNEYQARVSYDLEDSVICDEVHVPPRYAPVAAAADGDSDQAQAVASTASVGGFELGGQALSFAHPDLMHSAGMTWVKRQVKWHGDESAGSFQHVISSAHANGFKVLLSVIGVRDQISGDPAGYYQRFATFLAGLAAGGADAIEIWNEMNIDREWPVGQISGANYTQMLAAAYNAIKSSNSNTMVISGAPAPTGFFQGCSPNGSDDNCYIQEMAQAGAANYLDCVGVHYNSGILPPDQTSGAPVGSSGHYSWYLPRMMTLYRQIFPSKPLCFTELGYLTGEGIGALPGGFAWASGTSLAEHANWLAGAVNVTRGSGYVRLMIVWNVDSTLFAADPQGGYAIVRPGGGCPACVTLASAMGV